MDDDAEDLELLDRYLPTARKAVKAERERSRYQARRQAGVCVKDGCGLPAANSSHCVGCLQKRAEKARAAYHKRRANKHEG